LQITLTVCANPDKVTEEARRLREGLAKIHEYLILTVPDHAIATLAGLARKGLVTEFRSTWVK
jgi:hypothetical protein